MPLKGQKNQRDDEPDPANAAPDEFATNENAVVIPLFAGEAKFALTWLCEPFLVYTTAADDDAKK